MAAPDYKAYGSFTAVYREARRAIYDALYADKARQVECVLNAMAEHCNQFGTCFVKEDRLMELTHYGYGTVNRALGELARLDYLRVHREYSVARQKELETWQLSPRVVWIAAPYIDMAEQLWNAASLYRNVMFNGQPESESLPETSSEPDAGTKHRTTTTTPTNQNKKAHSPQTAKNAQNSPKTARSADQQHEVPQQQRVAPASLPKSVPPVPLHECREPLGGHAETLAEKLANDLGTRLVQARQLLKMYDCANVEAGLRWIESETKKGAVLKPYGLLSWWLKENAIIPADQPRETESVSLPSGKYHDFFER